MAIKPDFRTFLNSSNLVLLIIPSLVTITKSFTPESKSSLLKLNNDRAFSSDDISKKFNRPLPLATREPSGIS